MMIKAIILWLLGATFEVRLINQGTGKDIPGRCVYKGGYWKARKVFKAKRYKLKQDQLLRLQAVSFLDVQQSPNVVSLTITGLVPDAPPTITKEVIEAAYSVGVEIGKAEPHDIGTSNARQSEFMHKHQDEPNVAGPEADDLPPDFEQKMQASAAKLDHECDSDGPMEYNEKTALYAETCIMCGEFSEQVADSLDPAV